MSRRNGPKLEEPNYELDLAPMLAMMVALIPVLLLSTAFVQVKIIDTPIPQIIAEAIAQDKKGERSVTLDLGVKANQELNLKLSVNGASNSFEIHSLNSKFDLVGLKKKLIEIKKLHPNTFRLSLIPEKGVKYKDLVAIMDAARDSEDENVRFQVRNKETGESADTTLLFPEVVFGNILEG